VALARTPIYRATTRSQLLMGGERTLVLSTAMLAAMLIFSGGTLISATVGVFAWFGGLFGLRQMAKADPEMSRVYLRHVKYAGYYPPRSTPTCER
jgi:type IV secretory pathway TrbD component